MKTSHSESSRIPPSAAQAAPDAERGILEGGTWQQRLEAVVELMREMSRQVDPQEMVRAYARRMHQLQPTDRRVSVSRRNLEWPKFKVTRYSEWSEMINPWKQADRLPIHEGGFFAELLYGNEPRIINDLSLEPGDPALEYLAGQRSLIALPHFDQGETLNMTFLTRELPDAFDPERFPEMVWLSSMFGRATQTTVLADQVKAAYEMVDQELRIVGAIQTGLLPRQTPALSTASFATYYRTSQRAGGDYYDFFPQSDGGLGILIADVSGHGTPAAVIMAVTHAIAHLAPPDVKEDPAKFLEHLNRVLAGRYTNDSEAFVTGFYGIYDDATQVMRYSSAGHNPPRVKSCTGQVQALNQGAGLPLGILDDATYRTADVRLPRGSDVIFYTDGITEAIAANGELYGVQRLDDVLGKCGRAASATLDAIVEAVDRFTDSAPPTDDRTLVLMSVHEL